MEKDIIDKIHKEGNADLDMTDIPIPVTQNVSDIPIPMTQDIINMENNNQWDSNFGVPLYTKQEQKRFVEKMQKNMQAYSNAVSEIDNYRMDRSTIIQNDTTIDPFKPPHDQKNIYQGRSIKEIYDEQVAGPKPVPKRIISTLIQ